MVDILSCHATLPNSAPLPSYRSGKKVQAAKYGTATEALSEVVEKVGREPRDFALHSLRIGGYGTSSRRRLSRASNPEGRKTEVRRVQAIRSEQHGGLASSVAETAKRQ